MATDLSLPIMIVDDDNLTCELMTRILNQLGFTHVDRSTNGQDAFDRLKAGRYGLVISDWFMQPITGYDLLKMVRADHDLAKTPFIMVTTRTTIENAVAAKAAGMSGFLLKPFTPQAMRAKIQEVVGPISAPASA